MIGPLNDGEQRSSIDNSALRKVHPWCHCSIWMGMRQNQGVEWIYSYCDTPGETAKLEGDRSPRVLLMPQTQQADMKEWPDARACFPSSWDGAVVLRADRWGGQVRNTWQRGKRMILCGLQMTLKKTMESGLHSWHLPHSSTVVSPGGDRRPPQSVAQAPGSTSCNSISQGKSPQGHLHKGNILSTGQFKNKIQLKKWQQKCSKIFLLMWFSQGLEPPYLSTLPPKSGSKTT